MNIKKCIVFLGKKGWNGFGRTEEPTKDTGFESVIEGKI